MSEERASRRSVCSEPPLFSGLYLCYNLRTMTSRTLLSLVTGFCLASVLAQPPPAIEWQKTLGGSAQDHGYSIAPTNDGGYIVSGSTSSSDGDVTNNQGQQDYWVVKLDSAGTMQWQKSLGGTGIDVANAISLTDDGGYIVAGYTSSNNGDVTNNHGGNDGWVVKLDNTGGLQWQKTLGGSSTEVATCIAPTNDGGFIASGYTNSTDGDVTINHGSYDYWVVKLNSTGALQWQVTLGGSGSDGAYSIVQTNEGGYLVAGQTRSTDGDVTNNQGEEDFWVVSLDSTGTMLWQRTLGGSDFDEAHAISLLQDGGCLVAGFTQSTDGDVTNVHGGSDLWVVELDGVGDLLWERTFGGSSSDAATSIATTTNGGFIVAGYTGSVNDDVTNNHGSNDYWVLRLDSLGSLQWQTCLGGSAWENANAIAPSLEGGCIVAGSTNSADGDVTINHGATDLWIVKLGPEVLGVSVEENGLAAFTCSPSPANDVIVVHCPWVQRRSTLTLADLLGHQVLNTPTIGPLNTLNVGHLPRGMYLVTLRSAEGIKTHRVVLE